MGLHQLYLGFFFRGILRMVLFIAMLGFFVGPQLAHICMYGTFRVEYDFVDIIGLILLVVNIISYILAIVESMRITEGIIATDSGGFLLR